jgi:hypothetical protein
MGLCKIHPHSSTKTAERCYAKRVGRRADKKLRGCEAVATKQVRYDPPKEVAGRICNVLHFYGVTEVLEYK